MAIVMERELTKDASTHAGPKRQNVDDLLSFVRTQANLKTEKRRLICKH